MNTRRIFLQRLIRRAALVCACGLAGMAAGQEAQWQKDRDAKIAGYTGEIALNPNAADLYIKRGMAEMGSDDVKAMQDFDTAIRLDPQRAEWWYERCRAREMWSDIEGAVADVSKAIELDPKNWVYYDWRVGLDASLGDNATADADQARAEELNPKPASNPGPRTRGPAPADQSDALRIRLDIHPAVGADADIRKIADAGSRVDCSDPDGIFRLVVENVSSKPVVLESWQTHRPWLEITDEGGATFSACPAPPPPQMPAPSIILAPGEKTVIEICDVMPALLRYLNFSLPNRAQGAGRQVTIRAVLQFKPGSSLGIAYADYWTGRVVSEPCKVTLTGAHEKEIKDR